MQAPERRAIAGMAAALIVAAGCGGDDRTPVTTVPDPDHARAVEADPYAVTCGDLARQQQRPEAARLVIHAEFALAQDPALREPRSSARRAAPWRACGPAATARRVAGRADDGEPPRGLSAR